MSGGPPRAPSTRRRPASPVFAGAGPDSRVWRSTHITMPEPRWTAEEIMAYADGLGSPDVYWATFGFSPTTYEPMLRAAYNELVAARAAAAQP